MRIWNVGAVLAAVGIAGGCGNGAPGGAEADTDGDIAVDDADETPDADDAGEDEADAPEADVEIEDTYCRACRWDDDCNPGDKCIARGGSEMACAPPCATVDDCPAAADCVARGPTSYCMPAASDPDDPRSCIMSTLGSSCPAGGCRGLYAACSDPAGSRDGFCTLECEADVDCDPGYNRCGDRGDGVRVCMEPPVPPPERCGADPAAAGVGADCSGGASCSGGADTCLESVDARLPALCSIACTTAGDCPGGTRCLPLAGSSPSDLARYCVPEDCTCLERVPGSMLDDALDALSLDRCDLYFSSSSMDYFPDAVAHDRFRLPWFDDVHNEWLRGEPFVRDTVAALDAGPTPRGLLLRAAELQGHQILSRPFAPELDPADPLTEAVAALIENNGGTADRPALRASLASLPADLREPLAVIVIALDRAAAARASAIKHIASSPTQPRMFFSRISSMGLPDVPLTVTHPQVQGFLIDDFGYAVLFQAAADLLVAIEDADLGRYRGAVGFNVAIDTPVGRIAIRDASDTIHDPSAYPGDILFVLDTGGNDTYRVQAGATASVDNPVSLLIDLGGSDLYGYVERSSPLDVPPRLPSDADGRYGGDEYNGPLSLSSRGRQGSGTLGIGILLDLGAEGDEYRSLRKSQGWGALGVGILYDAGGDDTYLCEAGCQGAATFGVGILLDDGEGIDRYEGYHAIQGWAYSKAVAVLYDRGGDDTYLAQPDDVLYYNPQDPGRSNSSMAQGMGFGRRADPEFGGDGVWMSGGLGILRDLAGDDDYECAVFCQGSGYWFGSGLLADGGGDDHYDARWYAQGGSAHYAIGALWDAAGADVYNETARRLNVTLGGGHDFSTAFLLDDAGDDIYGAPNLSIGAGNASGFGLFVDLAGADSYTSETDFSFGNANAEATSGPRTTFPTMGLFLDADGLDDYARPTTTMLGDDRLWTQRSHPTIIREYGAGVDRTAGVTGLDGP